MNRRAMIGRGRLLPMSGATTGATVLRCTSCLGGSMAMKFSMYCPSGLSPIAMVMVSMMAMKSPPVPIL